MPTESDEEVELLTMGTSGEAVVHASAIVDEEMGSHDTPSSSSSSTRRRKGRGTARAVGPVLTTPRLMIAGIATTVLVALVIVGLTAREPEIWNGTIIKSPMDRREYEYLRLANSLRVVLISDSEAEKAAASMAVHVGHFSDPDQYPGLAHFCEHMLFMGSSKYPKENEYGAQLAAHGGHSNAYTASEETVYFFEVDASALAPTLDIFAQFFITPLFARGSVDRELHAVDNEHRKNLQSDTWRLNMLQRTLANPSHPLHKFGTGSIDTLNVTDTLRDDLQKWYRAHYSANVMALVVSGREPLKMLRDMVENSFSAVPNNDLTALSVPSHPFSKSELPVKVTYIPVQDEHTLSIFWPLDMGVADSFSTQSFTYIAHILGHEAEGTLACVLKRNKKWITSLNAGVGESCRTFALFEMSVTLTDAGMDHTEEIVSMIMAYVNFLREIPPVEWVWKESKTIAELQFRYMEKSDPGDYVTSLSSALLSYPPQYVVSHPYTFENFDPSLIATILNEMSATNVVCLVGSRRFAVDEDKMKVEKWYGTKYLISPISPETVAEWAHVGLADFPPLSMIDHNPMMPSNLDVVVHPEATDPYTPVTLMNEPGRHLYYLADQVFLRPIVNIRVSLTFTIPPSSSPSAQVSAGMLTIMVSEALNSKVGYYAGQAGMSYGLTPTWGGLEVDVGGYSDKALTLLGLVLQEWSNLQMDAEFNHTQEMLVRDLENSLLDPPYIATRVATNHVLRRVDWTVGERRKALLDLSSQELQAWYDQWKCTGVEVLVHGNLLPPQAVSVVEQVVTRLQCGALPPPSPQQIALVPSTQERGGWVVAEDHSNRAEVNAAIEIYWGAGQEGQELKTDVLLMILGRLISEPCFKTLRQEQQLGYIAQCYLKKGEGAQGLSVLVQSGAYSASYLDTQARAFMLDIPGGLLATVTNDHFDGVKAALINEMMERPKRLGVVTARVWGEIKTKQFVFHRLEELATAAQGLTLDLVRTLATTLFDARKALASWTVPQGSTVEFGERTRITDVGAFHEEVQTWLEWTPRGGAN